MNDMKDGPDHIEVDFLLAYAFPVIKCKQRTHDLQIGIIRVNHSGPGKKTREIKLIKKKSVKLHFWQF